MLRRLQESTRNFRHYGIDVRDRPGVAKRQHSPEAVFVHMSTNKVYSDAPNELPLRELPTRYDYGLEEHVRRNR
jgi:hypothetical protein